MVKSLTQWSIRGSAYDAPELRRIKLSGFLADDPRPVTTSHVVRMVAPLVYQTHSGTLYRLEGPPEAEYATYCAKNNIALDLADPVKIKEVR